MFEGDESTLGYYYQAKTHFARDSNLHHQGIMLNPILYSETLS